MEATCENKDVQDEKTEDAPENIITASQLRREVERIIGNMSDNRKNNQNEEVEEESLIEVSMSEVTIKEHKPDKQKKSRMKTKRRVQYSSSVTEENNALSDSGRSDLGILSISADPYNKGRPVNLTADYFNSSAVTDGLSRKQTHTPGKGGSEFMRCPHRMLGEFNENGINMVADQSDLIIQTDQIPVESVHCKPSVSKSRKFVEKHVNSYNYNHIVLKKAADTMKTNRKHKKRSNKQSTSGRQSLVKLLTSACSKKTRKSQHSPKETKGKLELTKEEDTACYCGSGLMYDAEHKAGEMESGESLDQLFKAKVNSKTNPTNFVFRAIDDEAHNSKLFGEVQFVVDNKNVSTYPTIQQMQDNYSLSSKQTIKDQISEDVIANQSPVALSTDNQVPQEVVPSDPVEKDQVYSDQDTQNSLKTIRDKPERIEVYMFDHQDSRYLQTTDNPPLLMTEVAVYRAEKLATKIWAEGFSALHVLTAFITTFFLQTIKFILLALIRPLTTGVIQIFSDYFFKPLLTVIFNGLIQPVIIFVYNILTSFRDLCRPMAAGVGYFIKELANLVASFRICNYLSKTSNGPFIAQPHTNKV